MVSRSCTFLILLAKSRKNPARREKLRKKQHRKSPWDFFLFMYAITSVLYRRSRPCNLQQVKQFVKRMYHQTIDLALSKCICTIQQDRGDADSPGTKYIMYI